MTTSATAALPHVSVVIPCHNREDTVVEAVESVLTQDYPHLDVIAVDDADRTIEMLRTITDPRLSIVTNPGPRGPSAARNHGVAQSSAPWIAFQDSDDIWLPGRLSAQMGTLAQGAHVAGYCGMVIKADADPATPVQDRQPRPEIAPREGDILPSLTGGSFISTQMLIIRRDVFAAVGGFDEDLNALVDWELMLRVAQEGPVDFVDEDLVIQRMSEKSITRSSRKRLEAQEYELSTHKSLMAPYPSSLAKHHHRLAGGYRRFSEWRAAADHASKAVEAASGNMRYRLYATYLRARALIS